MHHRTRSCVIVRAALRVRQMTTATPGLHVKSVHSAPTPPTTKTLSPSPTRHGASPALLARLTTTPTRARPVIRALRGQRTQLRGQAMPRHVWIVRRVDGHRRWEPQRAQNVQLVCSVEMETTAANRVTKEEVSDVTAQAQIDRLQDRVSSCPMPTAVRPSSSADRRGHALARAARMCVLA